MEDRRLLAERPGSLHEVGPQRHPAPHLRTVTPGDDDRVHAAVGDRDQRQPAGGQLGQPLRRQPGTAAGHNDPIVRRAGRPAVVAVAVDHGDLAVQADTAQRLACFGHHLLVGVQGDHRGGGDGGQQGGVVAGAGTDLQHPHAGGQFQGLQHLGHQRRLGTGAGGGAPLVEVSYQRLIAVDAVQNLSWREAVLGHVDCAVGGVEAGDATVTPDAGERLLDGLGAYGALRVENGAA
jgi:hypothetical protein